MKQKSIKVAILVPVLLVLIIGIVLMVFIVGRISSSTAEELTDEIVIATVAEYANKFEAISTESYSVVHALAPIVKHTQQTSEDPRTEVIETLAAALTSNESMLGIWSVWEPDALDGRDAEFAGTEWYDANGRFVPYLYKTTGGYGVEALSGYDDAVEGAYYQGAKNSGKPYITDPFFYTVDGQNIPLYSVSVPIISDGVVIGAVGADIKLEDISEIMNKVKILEDGYVFTLSPDGLVATHSNDELVLKSYKSTWMDSLSADVDALLANGGDFEVSVYSDIAEEEIDFFVHSVTVGDTGRNWAVCGMVPTATVNASSNQLILIVSAIGFSLILLVGVTIFLIVRRSLRELPTLTSMANDMAVGNINKVQDADASNTNTKNEIQLLKNAFATMAKGIKQQAATLAQIAEGDYSGHISVRSDEDIMNKSIEQMLDHNNMMLSEIKDSAVQVGTGASHIASGAQSLATGSTQQAASIEELSAAMTEIQKQAEENREIANDTLRETEEAGRLMEISMGYMSEMNQAMESINESSQSIGRVIKVIDDIAFQTNILALNAAVEAARAGQHGKGFAVVADEVRNLASKSAEAASETATLIEHSMSTVGKGSEIATKTGESLIAVGEIAASNAENMQKLSDASSMQSNSISEVRIGINQISDVVQANSATSEESAASAEELSAQADVMNEIVGRFNLRESGAKVPLLNMNGAGIEMDTDKY